MHNGRWTMTRGMPAWSVSAPWRCLHAVDPDHGHITWFGYGDPDQDVRDVLPLQRLSPITADRVKSYRRQLNEGILPPALLWWISGLNALVVLDGHDRISAALAQDAAPEVIVLAPAEDPAWISMLQRRPIRAYEGHIEQLRTQHDQGNALAAVRLANTSRRYAEQLRDITRSPGRTRAWPLPGGRATWEQYAMKLAPTWTPRPD